MAGALMPDLVGVTHGLVLALDSGILGHSTDHLELTLGVGDSMTHSFMTRFWETLLPGVVQVGEDGTVGTEVHGEMAGGAIVLEDPLLTMSL